eukprot:1765946-Rhodomonas_salina.4
MPGTDLAYAYAMSGTDLAYAATRLWISGESCRPSIVPYHPTRALRDVRLGCYALCHVQYCDSLRCYAMCSTAIGYDATRCAVPLSSYARAMRCPTRVMPPLSTAQSWYCPPICLRACYAMSAYDAIFLRACYAKSGTDIPHLPTDREREREKTENETPVGKNGKLIRVRVRCCSDPNVRVRRCCDPNVLVRRCCDRSRAARRKQTQKAAAAVQSVPGMRAFGFDFASACACYGTFCTDFPYGPTRGSGYYAQGRSDAGTDFLSSYALATQCPRMFLSPYARAMRCPVLTYVCCFLPTRCAVLTQRMVLQACYAMSGTDVAYAATRRHPLCIRGGARVGRRRRYLRYKRAIAYASTNAIMCLVTHYAPTLVQTH